MRIIGKDSILKNKYVSKLVHNESVKYHIKEYCRTTSVHGIKYFIEEDRPIGERIYWVFLFLLCVILNAYLVNEVWIKWNDSPVIVSFAEMTTPVWNVPFPAVTICSEVKSRATVFNFTSCTESSDDDDFKKGARGDISLLCDDHIQCDGPEYVDDTTMDLLTEVAPPFLDTIFICRWKNFVSQNCSDIFTKTVTDEGVCYTFNMLDKEDLFQENVAEEDIKCFLQKFSSKDTSFFDDSLSMGYKFTYEMAKGSSGTNWITYFESDGLRADGWTLDGGYSPDASLDNYPYRALQSGTHGGLYIVLKANRDDADMYCKGPVRGFKILLHNPAEFPKVGERFLRIPLSQEVIVVVQPNIMTTSEGLRSYSPHDRHCYLSGERYLSYFKVYTQPNCQLECLTNYTRRECGCVALHMPRKGETKVCGPKKKKCMVDAAHQLRLSEIDSAYKSETMGSCDCLPACTSIGYNTESSQADFNFHAVLGAYGDNVTEYLSYDASRITIFFKDKQFTTSRRNELYGIVDFLANVGGLLGLYCGVSLMSIAEIPYYTTLRIWGNIRILKKAQKKNEENQEINTNEQKNIDLMK